MHLNLKYFGSLDILGYYLPTKGIFPVGFGVQCTIDKSQQATPNLFKCSMNNNKKTIDADADYSTDYN